MAHLYNEILLSHKKECATDTGNHMDEAQMYYAEWKKPDSKDFLLCDSTYMTFLKSQSYRDGEQIRGCLGLGMGEAVD